jgi:hypothetical protein
MTKKLKNLCTPLFIGILIFTVACNKDKDNDPEQAVLLKKAIWSNSNQSSETVYEYDSQNRLVTMTEKTNETISVNTISYNSNGKPSERVRSQNGVEDLKFLYSYTDNLITYIIQSKTDGQWVDGPKTEYTLDASGKIIKLQSFYKVAGEYVSDSYQLQSWEGGKIVKQENWSMGGKKVSSIIVDLDDKNYPYANFGIINGLYGFFENNVKKQTIKNEANEIISSTTYSYEYNEYNFPSKSWQSKTNEEDTTDPIVNVYEYTIR